MVSKTFRFGHNHSLQSNFLLSVKTTLDPVKLEHVHYFPVSLSFFEGSPHLKWLSLFLLVKILPILQAQTPMPSFSQSLFWSPGEATSPPLSDPAGRSQKLEHMVTPYLPWSLAQRRNSINAYWIQPYRNTCYNIKQH